MSSTGRPLVSVVTPVYNGEAYLAECIESVLAQTYGNYEYIILDNCSTDSTLEIAKRYQETNQHISVHSNDELLEIMPNWNRAMTLISGDSKYCKVVHADDLLMPDCVSKMVEVAEKDEKIGIVGSYRIDEDHVNLDDMPYPSPVSDGRDICRRRLRGGRDLFGSPTSLMYRASLVRERGDFYNVENIHADTEVCFDLLMKSDFGFVHQVLTYTRRHNESVSHFIRIINTHKFNHLYIAYKYGRELLDGVEYGKLMRKQWKIYYRFLGKSFIQILVSGYWGRRREFYAYHAGTLKKIGHKLNMWKLAYYAFAYVYNTALHKMRLT